MPTVSETLPYYKKSSSPLPKNTRTNRKRSRTKRKLTKKSDYSGTGSDRASSNVSSGELKHGDRGQNQKSISSERDELRKLLKDEIRISEEQRAHIEILKRALKLADREGESFVELIQWEDRSKELESILCEKNEEVEITRSELGACKEELERAMEFQKTTIAEFESLQQEKLDIEHTMIERERTSRICNEELAASLEENHSEKDVLSSGLKCMTSELHEKSVEVEKLISKNKETECRLEKMSANENSSSSRILELESLLNQSQNEVISLTQKMDDIIHKHSAENYNVRKQIVAEINAWKRKLSSKNEVISEILSKLKSAVKDRVNLNESITRKTVALRKEKTFFDAQIDLYNKRFEEMNATISILRSKTKRKSESLRNAKELMHKELSQMKIECDTFREKSKRLEVQTKDLVEKEKLLEDLYLQNNELQSLRDSERSSFEKKMEKSTSSWKLRSNEESTKSSTLENDVSTMVLEIAVLKVSCEKYENRYKELSETTESLRMERDELATVKKEMSIVCEDLRSKYLELQSEHSTNSTKFKELQKSLDSEKETNMNFQQQLECAVDELEVNQKSRVSLEERYQNMKRQSHKKIGDLESHITPLKSSLEILKNRAKQFKEDLESERENNSKALQNLDTEIGKLQDVIDSERNQVRMLKIENSAQLNKINALCEENESLKVDGSTNKSSTAHKFLSEPHSPESSGSVTAEEEKQYFQKFGNEINILKVTMSELDKSFSGPDCHDSSLIEENLNTKFNNELSLAEDSRIGSGEDVFDEKLQKLTNLEFHPDSSNALLQKTLEINVNIDELSDEAQSPSATSDIAGNSSEENQENIE
eukprot:732730_1